MGHRARARRSHPPPLARRGRLPGHRTPHLISCIRPARSSGSRACQSAPAGAGRSSPARSARAREAGPRAPAGRSRACTDGRHPRVDLDGFPPLNRTEGSSPCAARRRGGLVVLLLAGAVDEGGAPSRGLRAAPRGCGSWQQQLAGQADRVRRSRARPGYPALMSRERPVAPQREHVLDRSGARPHRAATRAYWRRWRAPTGASAPALAAFGFIIICGPDFPARGTAAAKALGSADLHRLGWADTDRLGHREGVGLVGRGLDPGGRPGEHGQAEVVARRAQPGSRPTRLGRRRWCRALRPRAHRWDQARVVAARYDGEPIVQPRAGRPGVGVAADDRVAGLAQRRIRRGQPGAPAAVTRTVVSTIRGLAHAPRPGRAWRSAAARDAKVPRCRQPRA